MNKALQMLADEGLLLRARVEGWKEPVFLLFRAEGVQFLILLLNTQFFPI